MEWIYIVLGDNGNFSFFKGTMIKIWGIIILIVVLPLTFWWVTSARKYKGYVLSFCATAVFVGIALIIQDRIIEFTIEGIGTIKAAAEQATLDAKQVSEIRQRIEAQSATIDLVAMQAGEAKKLSEEMDETLQKASKTLSELQQITEFTMTVVAAQNDDRKAFDQLKAWANDKSFPLSARAKQAWNTIFEEHSKPQYISYPKVPWREGLDPSKLTFKDLLQIYGSAPSPLKPMLIEYIWNRQDIPKKDRMQFLIDVMQHDQSLRAVEYAGIFFAQGAQLTIKQMAVDHMLSWWRDNKNEIQ